MKFLEKDVGYEDSVGVLSFSALRIKIARVWLRDVNKYENKR